MTATNLANNWTFRFYENRVLFTELFQAARLAAIEAPEEKPLRQFVSCFSKSLRFARVPVTIVDHSAGLLLVKGETLVWAIPSTNDMVQARSQMRQILLERRQGIHGYIVTHSYPPRWGLVQLSSQQLKEVSDEP